MSNKYIAALTADIHKTSLIGDGSRIGRNVTIQEGVVLGKNVTVRGGAKIGAGSVIWDDALVGPRVRMTGRVLVMAGAKICPNDVESVSSDGRIIRFGASIGPRVLLHDEVELAEHAIIPTQQTIACIGNMGSKRRVVTIYGSDEGPRYSIGCQVGVDMGTVRERVAVNANTTELSADTYVPYLGVFEEIGGIVQRAYDGEEALIDEINSIRMEIYGNRTLPSSTLSNF